MKLIIDIPEMAYEAYKEWHKNKVASAEQSLIANGIPYEENPKYFPPCEDCNKKMEEIRQAYDKMKAMERPQGETNAEIFKQTFGIYATELWSMKEAYFLEWLNAEAKKDEI